MLGDISVREVGQNDEPVMVHGQILYFRAQKPLILGPPFLNDLNAQLEALPAGAEHEPWAPANSNAFSNFGMAVISSDFSSTLRCPSTGPLPSAHAETMCTSFFLPVSRVPHKVLPSMATTSPAVSLAIDETQSTNPFFHLFRIERGKHPVEGVVRRDAKWKGQKRLQPLPLGLAILRPCRSSSRPAQHRRNGHQKNLFQQVFSVPFHARIAQLSKLLQGIIHFPFLPISRSLHIAIYGHLYASDLTSRPVLV